MRLKDYFTPRLDEKLSKADYDEALKNANILVGPEFEMIHETMLQLAEGDLSDLVDEYEDAHDEWDFFTGQMEAYKKDREKLQDEIDSLQYDLDSGTHRVGQEEVDLTDDEIADIEEKISTLQSEMDDLEHPYPGEAYIKYMRDIKKQFDEGPGWDDYTEEDMHSTGEIAEPMDMEDIGAVDLGDEDTWVELVKDNKQELFGWFPLGKKVIRVSRYHELSQKPGDTFWKAEFDTSIAQGGGIEMVGPPMPLPEFINIGPKICDWIKSVGTTTSDTGFHIHMGLAGVKDLSAVLDPVKLVLLTDEGYIWKFFEERKFNSYCKDTKDTVKTDMSRKQLFNPADMVDVEKLKGQIQKDHYLGINFEGWESGHVEFRHMGGDSYHTKWGEIRGVIARYAHAVSAACDPDWKRQEYQKKLARIANQLEYMKWDFILDWWDDFARELQSDLKRVQDDPKLFPELKKVHTWVTRQTKQEREDLKNLHTEGPSSEVKSNVRWNADVKYHLEAAGKKTLTKLLTKFFKSGNISEQAQNWIWGQLDHHLMKGKV